MDDSSAHVLMTTWRGIVTPEEAERYWQIRPVTPVENVVRMTTA
jgi:hypothetical protein